MINEITRRWDMSRGPLEKFVHSVHMYVLLRLELPYLPLAIEQLLACQWGATQIVSPLPFPNLPEWQVT
jgi:hypothetical protein